MIQWPGRKLQLGEGQLGERILHRDVKLILIDITAFWGYDFFTVLALLVDVDMY